jgi:hypothetical protein
LRRQRAHPNPLGSYEDHDLSFACLKSVGRRVLLGRSDAQVGIAGNGGTWLAEFQLAGPYVTFTRGASYRYAGCVSESVKQYDLRSGKISLAVTYTAPFDCLPPLAPNGAELVTSAAGYAAWVVNKEYKQALLMVHDKNGIRTLDQTVPDVVYPITAVQITGTVITWEDHGQLHSATLR